MLAAGVDPLEPYPASAKKRRCACLTCGREVFGVPQSLPPATVRNSSRLHNDFMSGDGKLTELDRAIVARYVAGASVARLVTDLGVARSRVNRVLKLAGIPRRKEPTLWAMPPAMRARIIRAHESDLTGPEVADLVGVDQSLVYRVWKSEGLQRRQPRRSGGRKLPARKKTPVHVEGQRRKLPQEARDAWIETQYRDGLSMQQVADQVGVSRSTVAKVLRARGVPSRPPVRPQKLSGPEQAAVAARYRDGASLEAVAAEFGVAQETVLNILKRQGQPTRTEKKFSRKLPPEKEADLVARYVAGEPVETLAVAFGVNQGTVVGAVRRAGKAARKPGKPGREVTPEQAADITHRYQAWEAVSHIALDYGIARNRVTQIAVEGGAQPRKKRRAKGTVKRRGGKRDPKRSNNKTERP